MFVLRCIVFLGCWSLVRVYDRLFELSSNDLLNRRFIILEMIRMRRPPQWPALQFLVLRAFG